MDVVSPSLVYSGHGDRLLCAGLSILLHHQFSLGARARGKEEALAGAVRDYFASALSPLVFVWRGREGKTMPLSSEMPFVLHGISLEPPPQPSQPLLEVGFQAQYYWSGATPLALYFWSRFVSAGKQVLLNCIRFPHHPIYVITYCHFLCTFCPISRPYIYTTHRDQECDAVRISRLPATSQQQ